MGAYGEMNLTWCIWEYKFPICTHVKIISPYAPMLHFFYKIFIIFQYFFNIFPGNFLKFFRILKKNIFNMGAYGEMNLTWCIWEYKFPICTHVKIISPYAPMLKKKFKIFIIFQYFFNIFPGNFLKFFRIL